MTAARPTDDAPDLDSVHARVRARLALADQRYTAGRRQLVTLLAVAGRPVSLPELIEMAPALPQSSTYRNLDVMERTGLVRRLATGSEHARFELAELLLGHHHHLICVACGTVEDVRLDDEFEDLVDATLGTAAASAGFEPLHHSVDLHGRCANCRADA